AHQSLAKTEGMTALRRWAYDRYQLIPWEAQASVGILELSRTRADEGKTIPAGSLFGADGVPCAVANDVPFPEGMFGPIYVFAVCHLTGAIGNVEAGMVTDKITNIGDEFVVTNPQAFAGGNDAETPDEFERRCRNYYLTARRVTKEAVEEGARGPGVADAAVSEVIDPGPGLANYRVQAIIADQQGS